MAFAPNWFFSCLSCNAMRDTGESSLLLQELQWLLPLKGWLSFRLAVGFCYCLPLYSSPPADCPEDQGKQCSWDARHYMSAATDSELLSASPFISQKQAVHIFSGPGIFWWAAHHGSWTKISEESLVLHRAEVWSIYCISGSCNHLEYCSWATSSCLIQQKIVLKQSDIPLGLLQVTLKVQQRGSGSEVGFSLLLV